MTVPVDHWDNADPGGDLASLPQLALQLLRAYVCDFGTDATDLRQACAGNPIAMALLGRSGRRLDTDGYAAILPLVSQQGTVSWTELRYQDSLLIWWRSQRAAHLARALALLTGQAAPDDFFAAALLAGVGYEQHNQHHAASLQPWLRAAETPEHYSTYCQAQPVADAGTCVQSLLAHNGWSMAVRDAVRYHAAPLAQLADARPLLQITNLSWRIGWQLAVDADNLHQCARLLGMQDSLLSELLQQVDADVERRAQQLGLVTWNQATLAHCQDAQYELAQSMQWLLRVEGWQQQLRTETRLPQLEHRLLEILAQIARPYASVLWIAARDVDGSARLKLLRPLDDAIAADIAFDPARSLIATVAEGRTMLVLGEAEQQQRAIAIVDRQLFARINAPSIVLIPLRTGENAMGVLLCGAGSVRNESQFTESAAIARLLVVALQQRQNLLEQNPLLLDAQSVREWIHEVSNPLTIVGNYLAALQLRHADDTSLGDDLERIRQELARAQQLVSDPQGVATRRATLEVGCDVNGVVRDVIRLLSSGGKEPGRFDLKLAAQGRTTVAREALQQIVTNLLKNAVEVLDANGEVSIVSDDNMQWDGERYVLLTISDNGPGLPPPLRDNAFAGGFTTKAGHAGLGLHITKKLVDDAGGRILCRSSERGTQFQLLLPQRRDAH